VTSLLDTVVRRGEKAGRIAAVHRQDIGLLNQSGAQWIFLVVCEGRFEEWRADECSPFHAFDRPVAPVPPPTRPFCCSTGCKTPNCPNL
jgi:hypothetical protein